MIDGRGARRNRHAPTQPLHSVQNDDIPPPHASRSSRRGQIMTSHPNHRRTRVLLSSLFKLS